MIGTVIGSTISEKPGHRILLVEVHQSATAREGLAYGSIVNVLNSGAKKQVEVEGQTTLEQQLGEHPPVFPEPDWWLGK
jgi:hypothetical protein